MFPREVLAVAAPNDIYVGLAPVGGAGDGSCEEPDFSVDDADIQVTLASAIESVDHDDDVIYICAGQYEYTGDIAQHDGKAVGAHSKISIAAVDGAEVILDGGATISNQLFDFVDTDVFITGIIVQRGGGGIRTVSTVGLHSLTVRESRFYLNRASFGSAIYAESVDLAVTDSVFGSSADDDSTALAYEGANSASFNGGAIFATAQGRPRPAVIDISDSTFESNTADEMGGAIMVSRQTRLNISNSNFRGNGVDSGPVVQSCGGAIYLLNADGTQIEDSTFTGNHAVDAGGAIGSQRCHGDGDRYSSAPLTISRTTFTENAASCSGGAIDSLGLSVKLSTFTGNEAETCYGGAITAARTAAAPEVELIGNEFIENGVTDAGCCEGGALYLWYEGGAAGPGPLIRANTFRANSATSAGGAITLRSVTRTNRVSRNRFEANFAPRGGAVAWSSCSSRQELLRARRAAAHLLNSNRFRANEADASRDADVYRGRGTCGAG